MLKKIEDTLNKSCLIGLSYFNVQGEQLNQNILAGRVVSVDSELGITVELSAIGHEKPANFILPSNLSCWFTAPKGEFHTSQNGVKIINPDYLVTWDIFQTKAQKPETKNQSQHSSTSSETVVDGEQQWWQWRPRTQSPNVG
jgi:hypothetical protein